MLVLARMQGETLRFTHCGKITDFTVKRILPQSIRAIVSTAGDEVETNLHYHETLRLGEAKVVLTAVRSDHVRIGIEAPHSCRIARVEPSGAVA